MVNRDRVRVRNDRPICDGPVVYWMQRDQRAHDNWALLYAQECATEKGVPLIVLFNLVPTYGHATWRHYDFMLKGLRETESELKLFAIPFVVTQGKPEEAIVDFIRTHNVGHLVTDFNPMRLPESWKNAVAETLEIRFSEVDAHNIIPCWIVSDKQEFAAYTFRPKVHKKLNDYLEDFPKLSNQTVSAPKLSHVDWDAIVKGVDVDRSVEPVEWLTPGSQAGLDMLETFLSERLNDYNEDRNDPVKNGQSNMSPYLHFGQVAPQRVVLAVESKRGVTRDSKEAFLEELIVRRELTDNYCFYNLKYDTVEGAHEWAQETIKAHAKDKREYLYSQKEFESAQTHDELWNAMQLQMVHEGKMHGWCRMYWAKKILEWTPDVQTAIDIALYLNDKYEMDGRDPNGVVGVMWSICGVHDRAWTERPVFGKIRYMNYNGAKRKFDVAAYVARYGNEQTLFDD